MLIRKPPDIPGTEITDQSLWLTRRRFLRAVAGSPFLAFGDARSAQGESQAPPPGREWENPEDRLTPYEDITSYNNFFEFGTRKTDPAKRAKDFKTRPWSIRIYGECEAPGEIGVEDILKIFVQEERIYRLRCVEGWAMVVPWVGFSLAAFLRRFKPTSEAKYVSFTTLYDPERMPGQRIAVLDWPYREALRIDEAMHTLALLATGLYGDSLPNQNGAPLRLVIPWKYGFKSIKAIVAIGFDRERPPTSWSSLAPKEYGFYANVNPEVDHPRWSQRYHRNIGEGLFAEKRKTELFNGYAEQVAPLYAGMDLRKHF